MLRILNFRPELESLLPETDALLRSANLTAHSAVSSITLHGSRGLARTSRRGSDIDLSLIVDTSKLSFLSQLAGLLTEVLQTTLANWQSKVEPDLAAVFDVNHCGLKCFDCTAYNDRLCRYGVDCFGIFKIQKGFNGFVGRGEANVEKIYPCFKIWQRHELQHQLE